VANFLAHRVPPSRRPSHRFGSSKITGRGLSRIASHEPVDADPEDAAETAFRG
jgi:hypothetical protein